MAQRYVLFFYYETVKAADAIIGQYWIVRDGGNWNLGLFCIIL